MTHARSEEDSELPAWVRGLLDEIEDHTRIPDVIPAGDRAAALASMAGTLRRAGVSALAALAALRIENASRCEPPLADAQVRQIVAQVMGDRIK